VQRKGIRQADKEPDDSSSRDLVNSKRDISGPHANSKTTGERLQQHGSAHVGMIAKDGQQNVGSTEYYA
jgi:hypothetical protein